MRVNPYYEGILGTIIPLKPPINSLESYEGREDLCMDAGLIILKLKAFSFQPQRFRERNQRTLNIYCVKI